MSRATNARIAGVTFLVYIAVTFAGMTLFARATRRVGVAAQLAGIAQRSASKEIRT